jgi:hypothetical protein
LLDLTLSRTQQPWRNNDFIIARPIFRRDPGGILTPAGIVISEPIKEYPRNMLESSKAVVTDVSDLELYFGMYQKMEQLELWSELILIGRLITRGEGEAALRTQRLNSDCAILSKTIRDKLEQFNRIIKGAIVCSIDPELPTSLVLKFRRLDFDSSFLVILLIKLCICHIPRFMIKHRVSILD